MRGMNITFAHPFFTAIGGAELHIGWMVKDFLERGYRCRIVTGIFNRDVEEFAALENLGALIIETGYAPVKNPWRERLKIQPGIRDWLFKSPAIPTAARYARHFTGRSSFRRSERNTWPVSTAGMTPTST